MDPAHSPLTGLVDALAESERFRAFADDFPANARVPEPILALLLATLHRTLGRPLVCLLAEDEEARDLAEAVGWYIDPAEVALLPSRGVHAGSGLEPPAHLVGERARALQVVERGGLVCVSARALAEGIPPREARPDVVNLTRSDGAGLDALVESLAVAGYERVERVEERGQIAVRGGLVDIFPSTGREPLRVEFFGDDIEQIRAFSPFTQRTLHAVDESVVFPARERALDPEARLSSPKGTATSSHCSIGRPTSSGSSTTSSVCGGRRDSTRRTRGRCEARRAAPWSQPHVFEAQRPAIAARGLAEAVMSSKRPVEARNNKKKKKKKKKLTAVTESLPSLITILGENSG